MNKPLIYLKGTDLHYKNDVLLGEVFAMEDGDFYFWPINGRCAWSSDLLMAIGNLLGEKNAPIRAEMEEYFANDGKEVQP